MHCLRSIILILVCCGPALKAETPKELTGLWIPQSYWLIGQSKPATAQQWARTSGNALTMRINADGTFVQADWKTQKFSSSGRIETDESKNPHQMRILTEKVGPANELVPEMKAIYQLDQHGRLTIALGTPEAYSTSFEANPGGNSGVLLVTVYSRSE
tara:strand:- start:4237 stop:4710 length:474 start_codon:yes stop_codon:yes gene_type:complete